MSDTVKCASDGCPNEARMALRTTRRTRAALVTTVWWDDRVAPTTAIRYCREHGAEILAGFVPILVDADRAA